MSSAILAAVLSAVATTAGNIALSERQRKMNEENQDKMNEYNLPKNQVQRLMDAGINPNSLSMGQGSAIPGNTSASMNPYSTPSLSDPMGMISNSFLSMAQGKTEDQMREIRKQEAVQKIEEIKANVHKLGLESEFQNIVNTYESALKELAITGQKAQNRLTVWQTAKVKQEVRQLAKYIDQVMPEEIKKLISEQNINVAQLDVMLAQIANYNADTELKVKQGDVADTQAALNVEERGLTAQESSNYSELAKQILAKYQAEVNKLVAETGLTEQEAFYYLLKLGMEYRVNFMGIPLAGAGGLSANNAARGLQQEVKDKYFNNK